MSSKKDLVFKKSSKWWGGKKTKKTKKKNNQKSVFHILTQHVFYNPFSFQEIPDALGNLAIKKGIKKVVKSFKFINNIFCLYLKNITDLIKCLKQSNCMYIAFFTNYSNAMTEILYHPQFGFKITWQKKFFLRNKFIFRFISIEFSFILKVHY